jgi:SAM-dependent methyltransferase
MQGGVVLDCGCGAGDNAKMLKSSGWTVVGITISSSEQKEADQYCEHVYLANLERGLPPEIETKFNLVLMSHVLEHLAQPQVLLRDIHRVLAPKGIIAVALPNVLTYTQRLRFLLGQFEYTPQGIMDETHVRFYTFSSGVRLLESCGYQLLLARADGAFPLWQLRKLLPSPWVRGVNNWACRWRPGFFGVQCLYLAKPKT